MVAAPAVWIAREGSIEVLDEPLTSCSCYALRNGYFQGLRVFDSRGEWWVVSEVIPDHRPTLLDRVLNRQLNVALRFTGPERRALADVAEALCVCVDLDPGDVYSQFVEHDELKRLFRSAKSVSELLHHARYLGRES